MSAWIAKIGHYSLPAAQAAIVEVPLILTVSSYDPGVLP